VVACFGQHRNNNLYLYANGWTVRNNDDINDHCQSECDADVYGCRANLFRRYFDGTTNNV
jgi:hypothetical protein